MDQHAPDGCPFHDLAPDRAVLMAGHTARADEACEAWHLRAFTDRQLAAAVEDARRADLDAPGRSATYRVSGLNADRVIIDEIRDYYPGHHRATFCGGPAACPVCMASRDALNRAMVAVYRRAADVVFDEMFYGDRSGRPTGLLGALEQPPPPVGPSPLEAHLAAHPVHPLRPVHWCAHRPRPLDEQPPQVRIRGVGAEAAPSGWSIAFALDPRMPADRAILAPAELIREAQRRFEVQPAEPGHGEHRYFTSIRATLEALADRDYRPRAVCTVTLPAEPVVEPRSAHEPAPGSPGHRDAP